MYLCKRNKNPMMVVVDKSSTSPLFNGSKQSINGNKQMGGNGVAIDVARERLVNHDVIVEGIGKERQYPTREQCGDNC